MRLSSPRRLPLRLLVLASAGTLAAAPLLTPRAHRPAGTGAPAALAPHDIPEPPSRPLLAAGLAALGGAVALRRHASRAPHALGE